MRTILNVLGVILLTAIIPTVAISKGIQATTADGRIVVLNPDGTWEDAELSSAPSDGMVNLSLVRLEDSYGTCIVHMQYDNNTGVFFGDFAAGIYVMDTNGYSVGDGCGVGMENMRPGGIATCEIYVQNVPCSDVGTVSVSGWQYCIVDGQRDSSGLLCDPYLNVRASEIGVPLLQR